MLLQDSTAILPPMRRRKSALVLACTATSLQTAKKRKNAAPPVCMDISLQMKSDRIASKVMAELRRDVCYGGS